MKRRRRWRLVAGWSLALLATGALGVGIASYMRSTMWIAQRPPRGVYPPSPPEAMFLESRKGRVVWLWQRADGLGRAHMTNLHTPRQVGIASMFQSSLATPSTLNDPVDAPVGWLQWLGFTGRRVGPTPAAGVMLAPGEANPTVTFTEIMLPYWFLVMALGVPAAWLLVPERRSRRWAREGRCPGCGYDLRESPQRCPECGRRCAPPARADAPLH